MARVCGWARTVRIQGAGSFAFLELHVGSCFSSLQVLGGEGEDRCWVGRERKGERG